LNELQEETMNRTVFIFILLTIVPNLFAQGVKVITNATLIDGTGRAPIKDAVIVIEGARITQAGSKNDVKFPENAVVIDASGKFVTPGLADMHNHLRDGTSSRRPQALGNARQLLAFGVTTVFFPNANLQLLDTLKQQSAPDNSAYPHIFGAGPIVTVKGGSLSGELRSPNTADEARAVVKEMKAANVEAIKLGYDDNTWAMKKSLPLLKEEVVSAIIAEAHHQGLKVFVHAPMLEQAKVVLRAGADGLMHGIIDKPVDDEFITLMKKNRACYVSTLAMFEAVSDIAVWASREAAYDSRKTYPSAIIEAYTSNAAREQMESFLTNSAFTKTHLPTLRTNLKMINDAGILIVTGTDTGFYGVFTGLASHLELILHAEAGLKTADIIKAATINAARMIGREKESGTIEEGKIADLLILDANPLDDIRNIKRIHRIIKSGTVFDPVELLKR
jgi:imidazolonepropionase-like amidohydrolase